MSLISSIRVILLSLAWNVFLSASAGPLTSQEWEDGLGFLDSLIPDSPEPKNVITGTLNTAHDTANSAANAARKVSQGIANTANNLFGRVTGTARDVVKGVADTADSSARLASGAANQAFRAATDGAYQLFRGATGLANGAAQAAVNGVQSAGSLLVPGNVNRRIFRRSIPLAKRVIPGEEQSAFEDHPKGVNGIRFALPPATGHFHEGQSKLFFPNLFGADGNLSLFQRLQNLLSFDFLRQMLQQFQNEGFLAGLQNGRLPPVNQGQSQGTSAAVDTDVDEAAQPQSQI